MKSKRCPLRCHWGGGDKHRKTCPLRTEPKKKKIYRKGLLVKREEE